MQSFSYTKEQMELALQISAAYKNLVCLLTAYEQHCAAFPNIISSIAMFTSMWKTSALSDHIENMMKAYAIWSNEGVECGFNA